MTEIEAIEKNIKNHRQEVLLADSLIKLKSNKDFKRVFLNHYGKEYAAGLVRGKADAHIQNELGQAYVDAQINAISHLFLFMDLTLQKGELAAESIIQAEHERIMIVQDEE